MCLRTRGYLTKEEWGEVCLLGAVIVHEYVMTMLDELKIALVEGNVMAGEARHALSGIGGDVLQFNLTFALMLMKHKKTARPLCEQLNQKLARDFRKETFDFFLLVRNVEGHAHVLSTHLQQVAFDTLVRFKLDKDFKMLAQRANKLQPPHMDNSTPGSYYQVILFGCHENGEPYYGEVPCTHVCKYDNMAESSMNGTGWPLNWRDLRLLRFRGLRRSFLREITLIGVLDETQTVSIMSVCRYFAWLGHPRVISILTMRPKGVTSRCSSGLTWVVLV